MVENTDSTRQEKTRRNLGAGNARSDRPQQGSSMAASPELRTPLPTRPQQGSSMAVSPELRTPLPTRPQQGSSMAVSPELRTPLPTRPQQGSSMAVSPELSTPLPTRPQQGSSMAASPELRTPLPTHPTRARSGQRAPPQPPPGTLNSTVALCAAAPSRTRPPLHSGPCPLCLVSAWQPHPLATSPKLSESNGNSKACPSTATNTGTSKTPGAEGTDQPSPLLTLGHLLQTPTQRASLCQLNLEPSNKSSSDHLLSSLVLAARRLRFSFLPGCRHLLLPVTSTMIALPIHVPGVLGCEGDVSNVQVLRHSHKGGHAWDTPSFQAILGVQGCSWDGGWPTTASEWWPQNLCWNYQE
nr:uncharacterized protein LOC107970096 [Pan troglodytes]